MIITGHDKYNIAVVIDLLQAKALVELLRTTSTEQAFEASAEIGKAGYDYDVLKVLTAANGFLSVVGYFTDRLNSNPKTGPVEHTPLPDVENVMKPLIN